MRLKTKILLAILGTIFTVVLLLSVVSIGQLLRQRIETSYANNNVIAHELLYNVRHSLESGLRGKKIDPKNPAQLRALVAQTLREDEDLKSVLNAVIRYSPAVYDIAVVDTNDRALLNTDPSMLDQFLGLRPDYAELAHASLADQVKAVFGPPQVYDLTVPLDRNGLPFAEVRVGIRTTFLQNEMVPSLRNAIYFALALALGSLVVAAFLSNLALRPLTVISRRLDLLSQAHSDADTDIEAPKDADEITVVSTKIERLGQRMRNVQEVFTALKENLDQVLGNLQDGLVLFTHDGRAVLVSNSAARFLGIDRDRILGSPIQDILDRSTVLGRAIRDAFDARMVLVQEEVVTEMGRRVQISLDMIHDDNDAGGNSLGALLTLHDAESEQQLEDDLELSRRMAAIGRLTAGVGHEVKNPINAIIVHVELLRNKMANSPTESQRHIEIIHTEAQRLNRVVQTLVDFSRPVELRLADHDLRDIVKDVVELENVTLKAHNITLETVLSPHPLCVQVDQDLIKQALLNLVQNGVHAMPNGGTLTLMAERSGRDAVLTVRDTGVGIPADQLEKVFNLYFTTKATGSGIGLAMTYRILQLHHGKIDVQSIEGAGTAFTLLLPLVAPDTWPRSLPLSVPAVSGEAS